MSVPVASVAVACANDVSKTAAHCLGAYLPTPYMSLVCINVTNFFFCRVFYFPAVFSAGRQTCLVAWTSFMPLDRFATRLKKRLEKNLHD